MSAKMRAARAYAGETTFRLEDLEVPAIGPGEALVRVRATGISRGLISLWQNRRRASLLPGVLGGDIAGTVAEVGPGSEGWSVGDRVRVHGVLTCGTCEHCIAGRETMCPAVALIGSGAYGPEGMALYQRYHDGGLAQLAKVPVANLDRLPAEVPFDVGSRVHTVSVAYRSLHQAEPQPGDTLVVNGASGSSGASVLACAPLFGIERVVAVSRSRSGLQAVRDRFPELDVAVVATEELPVGWEESDALTEAVTTAAGSRSPDRLVDFLPGAPAVTVQTLFSLRKGGTAVISGGNYERLSFPYGAFMRANYVLKGSNGLFRSEARHLTTLLADGTLDIGRLITHRFGLEQANEALATVWERRGDPVYVIVEPN